MHYLPQRLKSIFFEKYFQVEKGTLHSEKNSEIIDLITHLQVNRVHVCPSRQITVFSRFKLIIEQCAKFKYGQL